MTSDNDRRRGLLARLRGRPVARSRGRRRLGAAVRLIAALTLAGGAYTVFAPGVQAQENPPLTAAAAEGKALFDVSCVTCHGRNAQGVEGRGPSLIGVGSASVEFQVGSGRMPMARQEAQAMRKPPVFTDEQVRQLGQYIQELGGGPQVPAGQRPARRAPTSSAGGELFRINCSQCHAFGGGGGALSSGKYAPSLQPASDRQIYAAMLSGPQNMPVFGDNQLTAGAEGGHHRLHPGDPEARPGPGRLQPRPVRPVHRGSGDLPGRHRRAGLREPVDCGQVVTGRIIRFQCRGAVRRHRP